MNVEVGKYAMSELERFNKEENTALAENKKSFDEISDRLSKEWNELEILLDNEKDSKKQREILDKMLDNTKEYMEAHREWQQRVLDIMAKHRQQIEDLLKDINPTIYKIYSKFTKRRRA